MLQPLRAVLLRPLRTHLIQRLAIRLYRPSSLEPCDRDIELARRDEFGPLAGAFDRMVAELSELITQDSRSNIAKRLSYSA
jgi:hypothetical protein